MSKIKVTACDNEIIGIVSNVNTNKSFILFDIKSGFNFDVNIEINLVSGDYQEIQTFDGTGGNMSKNVKINVPPSKPGEPLMLSLIGLDWGGKADFSGSVDGVEFSFALDPTPNGLIKDLAYQSITI
jgi:hypothetical protein